MINVEYECNVGTCLQICGGQGGKHNVLIMVQMFTYKVLSIDIFEKPELVSLNTIQGAWLKTKEYLVINMSTPERNLHVKHWKIQINALI